MVIDPDDYEQSNNILDRLRSEQKEFIRKVVDGLPEKAAFVEAYRTWVGKWDDTPEPLFILTEEDAQITANDLIGRELTPEEMRVVKKSVENGLDDWQIVMTTAVIYAAGESE